MIVITESIWKLDIFSTVSLKNGKKALGDWAVAMVIKYQLLYQLEKFWDLKGYYPYNS